MGGLRVWAVAAIAALVTQCDDGEPVSGGPQDGAAQQGTDVVVDDGGEAEAHPDYLDASCVPLLESYEASVAALASDDAACTTDEDCVAVDLYAPCQSLCDRAVAASRAEAFRAEFAALSQTYCAEVLAKGCGHVDHACDTAPRCVAGACTAEPLERGKDAGSSTGGEVADTTTDAAGYLE